MSILSNNKQYSNVVFGKNVSIASNVFFNGDSTISIGDSTLIARGAVFHTATHDYLKHPMWTCKIERPIQVGKHVWIGTGAIILPGITIGDYSIVGAGSVVTSHVPSCVIVAGNPAKIIKKRNIEQIKKNDSYKHKYPGKRIKKGFINVDKTCKPLL